MKNIMLFIIFYIPLYVFSFFNELNLVFSKCLFKINTSSYLISSYIFQNFILYHFFNNRLIAKNHLIVDTV